MNRGEPVHAEVDTNDASSGTVFTIYPMASTTARSLAAAEVFYITDILLDVPEAEGAVKIVADEDANGKRIFKATFAAQTAGGTTVTHHFVTPFACPKGVVPKLIAPAGQVDCVLCGFVLGA